jgi:hypothetical protein
LDYGKIEGESKETEDTEVKNDRKIKQRLAQDFEKIEEKVEKGRSVTENTEIKDRGEIVLN